MKYAALFALVLSVQTVFVSASFAIDNFPKGPDPKLTPGDVCHSPDSYRYPERIAYCTRAVDSQTKDGVIDNYDHQLGYTVAEMPRGQFKIDHFIPLCMGGSNETINLWPQHESVYAITDPLEPLLCQKMADGKILQNEAIDLIRQAKTHLDQVADIIKKVNSL